MLLPILTEQIQATFKDAARKLTDQKKREFTTQVALNYFEGSARRAERAFGWDRVSIQRGLDSLKSGVDYPDNYQARGRKKVETLLPNLAQDIGELVEGMPRLTRNSRHRLAISKSVPKPSATS